MKTFVSLRKRIAEELAKCERYRAAIEHKTEALRSICGGDPLPLLGVSDEKDIQNIEALGSVAFRDLGFFNVFAKRVGEYMQRLLAMRAYTEREDAMYGAFRDDVRRQPSLRDALEAVEGGRRAAAEKMEAIFEGRQRAFASLELLYAWTLAPNDARRMALLPVFGSPSIYEEPAAPVQPQPELFNEARQESPGEEQECS